MKTPLRELSESISSRIGGLDEELKMKLLEVNNLKSTLQVSAVITPFPLPLTFPCPTKKYHRLHATLRSLLLGVRTEDAGQSDGAGTD